MHGNTYTVEEVARQLKLHVKTVLRHIKEGRLRASKIGKSYRISGPDLNDFAGLAAPVASQGEIVARTTSIVEVPGISAEFASRIATNLQALLISRRGHGQPMHLDTAYNPLESHLKIILVASPREAASVLEAIDSFLGSAQ
ncbi:MULTISPECIES: helix-turn-helix domain-containing protein [unclassified Herbaspirillum]|uniref:helix-turn-helix domain-containing protein n=1 Tax=unclassified Herbaspirillum TaxID=2624150 RepID=UPI001152B8FF|nr:MULTISPECIES: helix-turn-helix domain-containing protein [unclassified Herbaspirillum]MBB5393814.1 excisionase family DNA binding protein [Herbaspirillum sp. SJZ102]TQK01328.1 excisionase family DNA binding protein [Herbaspirillum sp. SJZ130]TQK05724.1 excisionase family DNA binding protein [Herbaspirillum sp. SJZ106]TWC63249.1 excisionase family DNA binding protein [Herbaspirillum sp. SJZ099]